MSRSHWDDLAFLALSMGSFAVFALPAHATPATRPSPSAPSASPSPAIARTSIGPTSAAEAEVLRDRAKNAFDRRAYADALPDLERLLDRYPAHPAAREALRQKGIALLELGQAPAALAPLRAYSATLAPPSSPRSPSDAAPWIEAQLLLGRAYLESAQPGAAIRQAASLLARISNQAATPERVRALLLKAQAQVELHQASTAEKTLDSARGLLAQLDASAGTELPSEAAWTVLRLKAAECARPTGKAPTEAQVREDFQARGQCVQQLLLSWRDFAAQGPSASRADRALSEINGALADFQAATTDFAAPPGKRSAAQLKTYRSELSSRLQKDFAQWCTGTAELLRTLSPQVPESARAEFETAAQHLTQAAKGERLPR